MCYQVMKKRLELLLNKFSCAEACAKYPMLQGMKNRYNKMLQTPYARLMRLDNLTGFWLLVIPVLWAVCLVAASFKLALYYSAISAVGALVMRSAGCVINDIVDRHYDKKVERTAARPLASGEMNVKSACILLFGLLSMALMLLMMLPIYTMKWAIVVVILVCIYPFMKRYTNYAQVFLGFVFNSGVLIMWFAINPHATFTPFVLYFAAIVWTVAYDTIYAYQDVKDDTKLGLRSMAMKLGPKANDFLWNLYQLMTISVCIAGLSRYLNMSFFMVMAGAVYWFYPKIKTLDLQDRLACSRVFKLNVCYGIMMVMAILMGLI